MSLQNKWMSGIKSGGEEIMDRWFSPFTQNVRKVWNSRMDRILDVGCGEGYYAVRVAQALGAELMGLDISKEAVRCAAAAYKGPMWVCGTASHLPVADDSIGTLMSMFALTVPGEFRRVLRPDGVFLQVLAAQDHLLGLKSVIYPELHQKPKDSVPQLEGFLSLIHI